MTEKKPLMNPSEIDALARASQDSANQSAANPNELGEDKEFIALSQEVFDTLNEIAGQERFLIAEVITQSKLGGENSTKSIHTTPAVPEDGEFVIGQPVAFPSFWVMQERTRHMNMYIPGDDNDRIGRDENIRTTLMLNPAKDVAPIPLLDMTGVKRPGEQAKVQKVVTFQAQGKNPPVSQAELLWQGLSITAGIHDYFEVDTGSHGLEVNGIPGHGLIIVDEHKPFLSTERFIPHKPAV